MTANTQETLGRRIARLRLQHAMTQERLANIANVSAQAVSKWENDQSYPDILLLPLLAKTFGVSVDELLGVEEQAPVREAATEALPIAGPTQEPEPAPATEAMSRPAEEPKPEAELLFEPAPEPQADSEPTPEPVTSPNTESADRPASHVRIHVIREGRDAVNLAVPLAVARLVSNVTAYLPDQLTEGVDIASLLQQIQAAGTGTLVDIDDGSDHVVITLE